MKKNEEKQQNRQSYLKKKLFVAGAYLFVSAVLLVLVSFAQYKIKLEPGEGGRQIAAINTVIELTPSLSSHSNAVINYTNNLNGLQPGQKAQTYASDTSVDQSIRDNHRINVCVRSGEKNIASDAAVTFTLKIQGNRRIPLEFVMPVQTKDNTTVWYHSKPFYDYYDEGFVEYRFVDDSNNEPVFKLWARENNAVSLDIYVGWDSRTDYSGNLEREITDMDYRKEVELLTVRADILSSNEIEPQNKLTLKPDANEGN